MSTNTFDRIKILSLFILTGCLVGSCNEDDSPTQPSITTFATHTGYGSIGYNLNVSLDNTLYLTSRRVTGQITEDGEIMHFGSYGYPNWEDVNEIQSLQRSLTFNSLGERISTYETMVIYPGDDVVFWRGFVARGQSPNFDIIYKSPVGTYSTYYEFEIIAVDKNDVIYGVIDGWYDGIYGGFIVIIENDEINFIAGNGPGYVDGEGEISRFRRITDMHVDKENNLIIADPLNHCIRKVTPQGVVSTLAGTNSPGYQDGPIENALFNNPSGIEIDKKGNIYVADSGNHRIRKISPDGRVTTIAGDGTEGYIEGSPKEAQFSFPLDVAINLDGEMFILDGGNKCIRVLK